MKRLAANFALVVTLAGAALASQEPPETPVPIGPGITPPVLTRKVEPGYTPEALAERIQGIVALEAVISKEGQVTTLSVSSSLGYGLDEKAQEAIRKWRFKPGLKDGQPVPVRATIEVQFRLEGLTFDRKAEEKRTSFNRAMDQIARRDVPAPVATKAVETILKLSQQDYAPAVFIEAAWRMNGDKLPRDPEAAVALVERAAAARYGPALYEAALRRIEGRLLPRDPEQGMAQMRLAAKYGSHLAQYFLGKQLQTNPEGAAEARTYFQRCAFGGKPECQYRLANILQEKAKRSERDLVEAAAYLELAADQGLPEAKTAFSELAAQLTSSQLAKAQKLKPELVRH